MNAVASYLMERCKCNHCEQVIEFQPHQAGEDVECPGCGLSTQLFVKSSPRYKAIPKSKSSSRFAIKLFAVFLLSVLAFVLDGAFLKIYVLGFIGGTVASLIIYFLPTIIAFHRDHRNGIAILVVNFVFGWTVLGWVGALIWAIYQEKQ